MCTARPIWNYPRQKKFKFDPLQRRVLFLPGFSAQSMLIGVIEGHQKVGEGTAD